MQNNNDPKEYWRSEMVKLEKLLIELESETVIDPIFDPEKMEEFVSRDMFLRMVVEDMVKRGQSRIDALEVAFNSYILDDSGMIYEYENGGSQVELEKKFIENNG